MISNLFLKQQIEQLKMVVFNPNDVVFNFNNLWADNADYMSIQYSGTPALKTDFTRYGKRTFTGLMCDGYFSVKRYFLNNFYDGKRQVRFLFHCFHF